jgi:hypothetical protein
MPSIPTRTYQVILAALAALFVLLLLPLIGSLHDIEFLAGRELGPGSSGMVGGPQTGSGAWELFMLILRTMFIVALVGAVIMILTNRSYRKVFIIATLAAGAMLLIVEFVGCELQMPPASETQTMEGLWEELPEEDLGLQPPEREIASSRGQYVFLAVALSTLVVVLGGVFLAKWLKARPREAEDGFSEIFGTITDAAHRLRAGEDPYAVVLFCYQQMISILSARGRVDATCLTPREFELRLRNLGLSGESIAQLTAIFEVVRYAGRVDEEFADRALACLEAIEEAYAANES